MKPEVASFLPLGVLMLAGGKAADYLANERRTRRARIPKH